MSRAAITALVALSLSACTYTTRFNSAWLDSPPPPEAERVEGRVLVMTWSQDDAWVYKGHPSSFTGAGTRLHMPLGEITREAAVKAFGDLFRGGVDRSNLVVGLENYRVVVAPRAVAFDYKYNALRNLGFAVTPQAGVQVHVSLLDASGAPTWQRTYDSGIEDGRTYFIAIDVGERVAEAAHHALLREMRQAAADVKAVLDAPPSPAAAPPGPASLSAAVPSA
jgi:hypothetical protein